MKATVIRVEHVQQKDVLADYQKKLDAFLATPIDGKLPEIRFLAESEYTPEKVGGIRGISSPDPHITVTILWE
jgi:hypothetical protein